MILNIWQTLENNLKFFVFFYTFNDKITTILIDMILHKIKRGLKPSSLLQKNMPQLGIEPRTQGFSVPCSTN